MVDRFLEWQAKVGDHRFFAFLNMFDAHDPYSAPASWATKWVAAPNGQDRYDWAIAYMDHEVGRLIDELASRRRLDRTIVIVASDHGELFGEHQLVQHCLFLYLNSIHVPLVIRFPAKVPAGQIVTAPVGLDRLPATILDMLSDTTRSFPGMPLRVVLGDSSRNESVPTAESWIERYPWKEPMGPASRGSMVSVADSSWHWLHNNGDHGVELYQYRQDVVEAIDEANRPERAAIRDVLRAVAARRNLLH